MARLMLSSDTKKRIVDAIENEGLSLTEFELLEERARVSHCVSFPCCRTARSASTLAA